jgi:hypothetical protein
MAVMSRKKLACIQIASLLVVCSGCDHYSQAIPVASCSRVTVTHKEEYTAIRNLQVGQSGFIYAGHFYEVNGLLYVDDFAATHSDYRAGYYDIHVTRVSGGLRVKCDASTTAEHANSSILMMPVVETE